MFHRLTLLLLCAAGVFLLNSCGEGQDSAPDRIFYAPDGKHAAQLKGGRVYAPKDAPPQVKRAIAAANRIAGMPYRRGGGHRAHVDSAYDCSGAVSYVLKEAGLMTSGRHSQLFLNYGRRGPGEWITVYAKNGHVFMTICGVRFDTGGGGRGYRERGPSWHTSPRSGKGFVMRHPYCL